MEKFRLGVAQMTSVDDIAGNLKTIESLYTQAAGQGADLVVFPENSLFFRVKAGARVEGPKLGGPELQSLAKLVRATGVALMVTGPIPSDSGKHRNATLFFQPGQDAELVYAKIHLFNVDVPGAPRVRESDHFEHGTSPRILEWRGWRFGLSICYDMRFPEMYLQYKDSVDVLLVPSSFLVPTGEAHWHVLLRARAIESQCYVAAPAQAGAHHSGTQVRHTYGHTLVVDPWGTIMADLSSSPEVRVVELEREVIAKVRQQIPMSSHRRL